MHRQQNNDNNDNNENNNNNSNNVQQSWWDYLSGFFGDDKIEEKINKADSPSDSMLIKLHLPSISFTLLNSRKTANNAMLRPNFHGDSQRSFYSDYSSI